MDDPRAMASIKNWDSYRAWRQEGFRRSGYLGIISIPMGLTPLWLLAFLLLRPAPNAHGWLIAIAAAFALYLVIAIGLMLFAVLRLNAWKRTHPWEPPPSLVWK